MKLKGSSLIFSFVVLSFLLVSALSVAVVSVTSRRSSLATKNSNVAFQVADSAAEVMLAKIYKDTGTILTPAGLASSLGTSCLNAQIGPKLIGAGTYKATLYTKAGIAIACDDTTWRDVISKVKFQGIYQSTTRAIEVAITPKNDSIAWWKFDDGTGSPTAIDSSGNSNTGTLQNNPGWVPGKAGGALSFGGGSYVSMANESNFDFNKGDNFSGCAWVNTTTNTPVMQVIMSKLDGNNPFSGWEFNLYNPASNKSDRLQFYLINTHPTNSINVVATTTISPNTWYYACFTYDGSSKASGVKFYLNGAPESTASPVSDVLTGSVLNNKPLQVGARDGNNFPFSGLIDDVRVYNRTLSPTEMMDLWKSF